MKAVLTIPAPKYKSRLETAYAEHLDQRVKAGEIIRWIYEGLSFKLGDGARFTPDFYVEVPIGARSFGERFGIELHETKGYWKEAAKVRMKVAASMYPGFGWRVVTAKTRGGRLELPTLKIQSPEEAFKRSSAQRAGRT